MAAPATQAASKPSKPSKKKAPKAVKASERPESPASTSGSGPVDKAAESHDDFESPHIKELHKNIRNATKKLAAVSKTDSILSQHPGKSLDDLVAGRIINADQRAQILKKPALQAQIAQFEEQLAQYQKVNEQYQAKLAADKADWEKAADKAKADAVGEAKAAAEAHAKASQRDSLLVLSQFLRLAAYRREEGKDPESDESQAIEGVLLAIYSGDDNAVSSMLKLIEGSDDKIISVPGEQLQTTYAAIGTLAKTYQAPGAVEEAVQPAEASGASAVDTAVEDKAAADVDETELSATLTSEQSPVELPTNGHANVSVSDDTTTTAAETAWDSSLSKDETSISQEWVDVAPPKDLKDSHDAEPAVEATEATEAAPAVEAGKKQSWADDHPETTEATPAPTDANDGFHQVQRNRGRQEREGGERGRNPRGGRSEWRRGGTNYRGDGRGRGRGNRGENRGGAGAGAGAASRAPRRTEES